MDLENEKFLTFCVLRNLTPSFKQLAKFKNEVKK